MDLTQIEIKVHIKQTNMQKWPGKRLKRKTMREKEPFQILIPTMNPCCYCCIDSFRQIDQFNTLQNPELDPNIYGNSIYDKAGISDHWGIDF